MRVIALLSGGKDSVAAIECARNFGWDVVAALTIIPAEDDAWMFHTPNLAVVRGVAQCLGLPLVEAPCRTGLREEVEDLQVALAAVRIPLRVDAIISGALASEFQRTRIETVGHRLGLKTFTPLWHKEPRGYVDGVVRHWDIRLSRCAADGVPNAWAGNRLDGAKSDAMQRHPARPHVAGEGGEYETLVLDCPAYSRRIVVDEAAVHATASRATWAVSAWHTEAKTMAA